MISKCVSILTIVVLLSCAALLMDCGGGNSSGGGGGTGTGSSSSGWTIESGVWGKETSAQSVAVDTAGNIYIAGQTAGSLHGRYCPSNWCAFIVKYDSTRNRLYTNLIGKGPATSTFGSSVAVDSGGNAYIVGETNGALVGPAQIGLKDYFIAKYSPGGTLVSLKQIGSAGAYTHPYGVTVDSAGNVYVTGDTTGGLDGKVQSGDSDLFVTKYTTSLDWVYTIQSGTAGASTSGNGISTDPAGNVYVTGYTTGGLDGNTAAGVKDMLFSKYTSTGAWVFTRQKGEGSFVTIGYGITVDSAGGVYVTGETNAALDGNLLMGIGTGSDYFIAKYTAAGAWVYTKQRGVELIKSRGAGIAVDSGNAVYVTGITYGGLDGNTLIGKSDYFVAKFTSIGDWMFTRQSGVTNYGTYGYGIAIGPGDDIYITGMTTGGLDGAPIVGSSDYYIVKYDTNGGKQ